MSSIAKHSAKLILLTFPNPSPTVHESRSHSPGRNAHHLGWRAIAFTPRWTSLYRSSLRRARAFLPLVAFGPMRARAEGGRLVQCVNASIHNKQQQQQQRDEGRGFAPKREVPSGRVSPVQNTSAAAARRGQTIESRFSGEDCSLQRGIWPIYAFVISSNEP